MDGGERGYCRRLADLNGAAQLNQKGQITMHVQCRGTGPAMRNLVSICPNCEDP